MRSRFWTKKKRLWIFWTKKNGLLRFSRIFELFELTPTPIPPLFISDLPTTLWISFTEIHVLGLKSQSFRRNSRKTPSQCVYSNYSRIVIVSNFDHTIIFSISNSINRNYSWIVSGNSILNLIPFLIVWLQGFLGVVGGWVYTLLVRVVPRI